MAAISTPARTRQPAPRSTIKQVASTMKACLPKIDQQSAAYSAALSSAATYTITARQLHLVNGAGKVALTFAVMDAGVVAPPAVAPTRVMTPTRVVTATAVPTTTVATTVTLPLEGTSWTLSGLADAKGVVTQPLTSTQVTAMFKAGRITGSAGCNNYSAAFRTTSTTLQINSAVALTRKACEPAISKQEAAYLNALGRSATYKITGAKLELRNAAGAVVASFTGTAPAAPAAMPAPAVRTPAPVVTATQAITMAVKPTATVTPIVAAAQPPASLANTTWKWARSITPAEALDVANSDKYSVVFKPDGTLSIVADCNRASGTYKINGSQMQIKLDATRQAACPAGSLSSQFLKNLQASVLYFMDNGALFIDLAADTGTMKFVNAGAAK